MNRRFIAVMFNKSDANGESEAGVNSILAHAIYGFRMLMWKLSFIIRSKWFCFCFFFVKAQFTKSEKSEKLKVLEKVR